MNILAYTIKTSHPAIDHNMNSLINGFSAKGHSVISCNVDNADEYGVCIALIKSGYIDMSVSFNGLGMLAKLKDGNIVNIYREIEKPHVSILLDEPFNKHCSGYDVQCKHHLITYLDRSNGDVLNMMGVQAHKLFMPLGGTENNGLNENDRKFDVVFSAACWGRNELKPKWREESIDWRIADILDDMLEIMMGYPVNVLTAATTALEARGGNNIQNLKELLPFFWWVLLYVKPWRRKKILETLIKLGIKVHVFGAGWNGTEYSEKIIDHGAVSYADMLDIINQTKVLVNDEACFNDGAHDRVFTGMLNGAVVVSEYSLYLDEQFFNNKDLFMYDWKNIGTQLGIIEKLLTDDWYRNNIAANAYKKVINKHTWNNRANHILRAVNVLYGIG